MRRLPAVVFSLIIFSGAVVPAVVYAQSAHSVHVSGYVQLQYERTSFEEQEANDRAYFRRLVVAFGAPVTNTWSAQVQLDFGPIPSGDRLIVKDAFLRYTGFAEHGLTLTIGNQKMPFSRSLLVSTTRRSFVERPFTGDRGFGSPGRAIGVKLDGHNGSRTTQWSAAVASALHGPNAEEIRIDGLPVAESDWNEGVLLAGRVEWFPRGEMPRDQADFGIQGLRTNIGMGAYVWQNDGDRNLHPQVDFSLAPSVDLEDARGVEFSGGLRGHHWSADAEYHHVHGSTVVRGFEGGLYHNGQTSLDTASAEVGYMLLPPRLEVLGGVDTLDAATFDAVTWRPSAGAAWYFDRHNIRLEFIQRETFNANGLEGVRARASYLQMQIVF